MTLFPVYDELIDAEAVAKIHESLGKQNWIGTFVIDAAMEPGEIKALSYATFKNAIFAGYDKPYTAPVVYTASSTNPMWRVESATVQSREAYLAAEEAAVVSLITGEHPEGEQRLLAKTRYAGEPMDVYPLIGVLKSCLDLLDGGWMQGSYFGGTVENPKVCLIGSVHVAVRGTMNTEVGPTVADLSPHDERTVVVLGRVLDLMALREGDMATASAIAYNDSPGRTKDEVLNLVRKGIVFLEGLA